MPAQASPFLPAYQNRGAKTSRDEAIEVADWVESFEKEYRAANERGILVDRSYRGFLRVSGKDRVSFLHNMLSQDVKTLPVGKGRAACFLTNKGKLVADMLLFKEEDCLWLTMESSRLEPLEKALSRYIISDDVKLEDESEALAGLSVEGPRASELLLRAWDGEPADGNVVDLDALEIHDLVRLSLRGVALTLTAARHGPGSGFDLWIPREKANVLLEVLLVEGADLGVELAGRQVAETRRIEIGLPRFGKDMDESHMPLEARLEDAIHFEKGCYIGQEYVVRLAHRGQVSRKLVGLRVQSQAVPEVGATISSTGTENTQEIGKVTSAASSPSLSTAIALGYVKRGYFDAGTKVRIAGTAGELSAEVSPFPLVK